jgi:hypothetical protein
MAQEVNEHTCQKRTMATKDGASAGTTEIVKGKRIDDKGTRGKGRQMTTKGDQRQGQADDDEREP